MKARKARGESVRVVSTQLVEAGVDLDFAVVYRALAGMDALAQAAGRCNREGKLTGLGELRVFVAETSPPRGVPRTALEVTRAMLAARPALVQVPRQAQSAWLGSGAARLVADAVVALDPIFTRAYDERFGLLIDRVGVADPASLIG